MNLCLRMFEVVWGAFIFKARLCFSEKPTMFPQLRHKSALKAASRECPGNRHSGLFTFKC